MSEAAPVGFSSSHPIHNKVINNPTVKRRKTNLRFDSNKAPSINSSQPKVIIRPLLFNISPVVAAGLILSLLSPSCSGSVPASTTMTFEPRSITETGIPYFQFQTVSRSGKEGGAMISLGVSTESVIFVRNGELFEAICEVVCQISNQETEAVADEVAWTDTIRTTEYRKTQSREMRYMSRFVQLTPGRYVIKATLTDRNSGKTATRVRRITVPDASGDHAGAAGIEIRYMDQQGRSVPLLSPYLDITAGVLDCSSVINNLLPGDSVRVTVEVLQGTRDSSLPRVPYSFAPLQGSLEHSGMSFEEPVPVHSDTLTLISPGQSIVEWRFEPREEGVYLLRVRGIVFRSVGDPETLTESTRPLVVVSRGFPRPSALSQLLGPLEFIMRETERDSLQRTENDAARRDFLEGFWRSISKNEQAASQLIKRFYGRVKEANEYFTSFTEGWRTDRGMIYIVLGPPITVQTGLQGEVWNYSSVDGDRLNSYFFRTVPLPDEFQSLEHLLLERQPYYDQAWFSAVDRWRSGSGY